MSKLDKPVIKDGGFRSSDFHGNAAGAGDDFGWATATAAEKDDEP